jgi:hypothetical protein
VLSFWLLAAALGLALGLVVTFVVLTILVLD